MTDTQLLTIAIAVIVPLSALLYSNSRITDVSKRIDDAKETLRAEMTTMRIEIIAALDRISDQVKALETSIETRIKVHELEHHK